MEKMKAAKPNLKITKEQINRKFLNLQTTYKRIKNRNKESGRNSTSWEFYDDFDEIYGTRHSINPPSSNLISSLEDLIEDSIEEPIEETSQSRNSPEPVPKKKKKDNQNEILRHLQEESEREQKRHEEIIAIEQKKMEIEEKRIEAMLQLKDVLEKTISKQ